MVMLSSTLRGRVLRFQTPALPPNALLIATLSGREAISQPYSFDLELISTNLEIDFAGLLQQPVAVGIKQGVDVKGSKSRGIMTHKIHGVLAEFEQGERGGEWAAYRATVVPRLWRLSLTQHSRIFLDKTVPQIVEQILQENGFTGEEMKVGMETRKILELPGLPVTATCVRVPVLRAHSESVYVETSRRITLQQARKAFAAFPGLRVIDDPRLKRYPMPLDLAGKDDCAVGRIREDLHTPNALNFWVVGDQLRKGAALNAVQIAERLVS